jgi:fibronectin-binding autotransporter adhesin
MTAQHKYLSSIFLSLSTFLESAMSNAHQREEAHAVFSEFILQKSTLSNWSVSELHRFLDTSAPHQTVSSSVRDALMLFVQKYPPYQTSVFLHEYLLALRAEDCSDSTVKNYRSDINQFFSFTNETEVEKVFTKPKTELFIAAQAQKGLKESSIRRKLVSIVQFALWLQAENVIASAAPLQSLADNLEKLIEKAPQKNVSQSEPTIHYTSVPTSSVPSFATAKHILNRHQGAQAKQDLRSRIKNNWSALQTKLKPQEKRASLPYLNLAIIMLFAITLGFFGYRQFILDTDAPLAYPTSPTRPNRVLQFQGRLTDTSQNPITTATDMAFRLYDANTAGALLWNSGTCSVTPDQDGIFNADLGSSCGTEISENVFTENSNVWLEVQIESETLEPRQSIKTVPYALNSETLQGYPVDATGAATKNTVVTMNNNGEVIFGEVSPTLRAVSGTFAIEAETLALRTTAGSNGNIVLDPDGTGRVNILSDLAATGYLSAPGATLSATYAGGTALIARGGPSGTANIQEWQNSAGTALSVVDEGGNLGIGTTNPGAKVQISGTGTGYNSGAQILLQNTSSTTKGGSIRFLGSSGVAGGGPFISASNYLAFGYNTTENMIVDTVGNVGIGTTTASAHLHLANKGEATGTYLLRVDGSAAAGGFKAFGNNIEMLSYRGSMNELRVGNAYLSTNPPANGAIIEGNVGIGSTSPAQKLDIVGNLQFSGALMPAGAAGTAGYVLQSNGIGVAPTWVSSASLPGAGLWDVTANVFHPKEAYAEVVDLAIGGTSTASADILLQSNGNAYFGGNVGVGTTAPAAKLQVAGTTRLGGTSSGDYISISATTKTISFAQSNAGSGGHNINFTTPGWSTDSISFISGANERMRITGAGNVGIGTTAPTSTLEIGSGQIRVPDGTEALPSYSFSNNSNLGFYRAATSKLGLTVGGTARMTYNVNGQEIVAGYQMSWNSGATGTATDITLVRDAAGTLSQHNSTNAQEYRIANTWTDASNNEFASFGYINNSNVFTIQTEANGTGTVRPIALMGGNVGVGTTSPASGVKLEVQGGNIRIPTNNYYELGNALVSLQRVGSVMNLNAYSGWKFYDTQNSVERVTINSNGNVGIGSSSPIGLLNVNGAATGKALAILNETGNQDILAASASGVTRFRIARDGHVYGERFTDISNSSYFVDPAAVTTSAILNGNVGIGTTTANYTLDVDGELNLTDAIRVAGDAGTLGWFLTSSAGGANTWTDPASITGAGYWAETNGVLHPKSPYTSVVDLALGGNSTASANIHLQSNGQAYFGGNVGVGTTSASDLLQLSSGSDPGIRISNSSINQANSGKLKFTESPTDASGFTLGYNGATNVFSIDSSDVANIFNIARSTGNVGIGTTTATQKLDVAGNTVIRGTNADAHTLPPAVDVNGAWIRLGDGVTNQTFTNGIGIKFNDSGTAHASIKYLSSSNRIDFGTSTSNSTLSIDGTPTLSLALTSGNVGVGTTVPSEKLSVQGSDVKLLLSNSTNNTGDLSILFRHYTTGISKVGIISDATGSYAQGTLDFAINSVDDASAVSIADSKLQISENGTKAIGAFAVNTTPAANEVILAPASGNNSILRVTSGINAGTSQLSFGHYPNSVQSSKAAILSVASGSYSRSTGIQFAINDAMDGMAVSASDTKMIINPNGNVGIGTTNPTQKLHISGGNIQLDQNATDRFISFGTTVKVQSSNSGNSLDFAGGSSTSSTFRFWTNNLGSILGTLSSTGLYLGGSTTPVNRLDVNGSAAVGTYAGTAAPSNGLIVSGNVGIGMTSPGGKLEIMGTTTNANNLVLSNSTIGSEINFFFETDDTGISGLNNKNLVIRGTSSVSDIAFSPSSAYPGLLMLDGSTGNVGIGTTAPSRLFDVNGGTGIVGQFSGRVIGGNAVNNDEFVTLGQLSAGAGQFWQRALGAVSPSNITDDVLVGGTATASARIRLGGTANADSFFNTGGNVGIGTTAPADKLHIVSASSGGIRQEKNDATGRIIIGDGNGISARYYPTYQNWVSGSQHAQASMVTRIPDAEDLGTVAAFQIDSRRTASSLVNRPIFAIANYGTTVMQVLANGNVGIGTTSPAAKLEVAGGQIFVPDGTAAAPSLAFDGGTGTESGIYSSSTGSLNFSTFGSLKFTIPSTGQLRANTDGTAALPLYSWDGDANTGMYRGGADILSLVTGGVDRVYINAGGNVGIGSTAPGTTLDVTGTGRFSSTLTLNGVAAGTDNTVLVLNSSNQVIQDEIDARVWGTTLVDGSGTLNYLAKWSPDSNSIANSIVFDNGTNVGVGTTTPLEKLHVVGNIKATNGALIGDQFISSSIYNSTNGTLITTDIAATTDNRMVELYIEGNSYSPWGAMGGKVQVYNYNATGNIIQTSYVSHGITPNEVRAFHHDGVLKFWVSQDSSFRTFRFRLGTHSGQHKITSIQNAAVPGTGVTSEVVMSPKTVFNNNVGIGTDTPTQKLHVEAGGIRLGTTSGAHNVLNTASSGSAPTGSLFWGNRTVCDSSGNCSGVGTLPLSSITAATATNTIDSLNFAQAWNWSTATTQNPMSLSANALTSGSLLSLTSSSASLNSTNGLLYVANTGASTNGIVARLQSNSTAGSGLTVRADGNVGIGTTGPTKKLEVAGQIKFASSFSVYTNDGLWNANALYSEMTTPGGGGIGLRFGYNDAGGGQYYPSIGFATSSTHTAQLDNLNILQSRVAVGSSPESFNRFEVRGSGKLSWGGGSSAPDTDLYRNAANVLRTGDTLIVDGNVGVGTTSPNQKLDVYGNIKVEDASGRHIGFANATGLFYRGMVSETVTTGLALKIRNSASGNADPYISLGSSAGGVTDALLVNVLTGNVGIGSTAPAYKLDVAGDINLSGAIRAAGNAGTTGYLLTSAGGSTNTWTDPASITGAGYWNETAGVLHPKTPYTDVVDLVLGGNSTASADIHLQSNGKAYFGGYVGIGTTNAVDSLTVTNTSAGTRTTALRLENNNSTAGAASSLDFDVAGSVTATGRITNILESDTTRSLSFSTWTGSGLTEKLKILGGGNVGIGTSNPTSNLHVYATAADAVLNLESSDTSDPYIQFRTNGTNRFRIQNLDNDLRFLSSGTTERMRILDNGNVGIGSAAPAFKLDVAGNINATTGYYYGGAGSPLSVELTRTVPTTVNDYVEIGNFSVGNGAHNYRISVTVSSSSFSVAKQYVVPVNFNNTTGAWKILLPASDGGAYSGNDFQVDMNVTNGVATLRLRRTSGATAGTANVRIESVGLTTDVFTASSATGSTTAPTAFYNPLTQNIATGNVGIGTSAPAGQLDVRGTDTSFTKAIGGVFDVGYASSSRVALTQNIVGFDATQGASGAGGIRINGGTGTYSYISGNGTNLLLNAGGGNVGVGTTNPVAKLQSSGAAQTTIPTGGSAAGAGLYITNTDQGYGMMFGVSATGRGWIQQQRSNSVNTQYDLSLNPIAGNVGIGTTTPVSLLSVSGTAPILTLGNTSTNQTLGGTVDLFEAANGVYGTNAYGFRLTTDGVTNNFLIRSVNGATLSDRLTILRDSGNVGIGTTGPTAMLEVQSATSSALRAYNTFNHNNLDVSTTMESVIDIHQDGTFPSTAANRFAFKGRWLSTTEFTTAAIDSRHSSSWGGGLVFLTKAANGVSSGPLSERMVISPTGNVGIGTLSPNATLNVVGSVNFNATTMTFDDTNLSAPITLTASDTGFDSADTGHSRRHQRCLQCCHWVKW